MRVGYTELRERAILMTESRIGVGRS